MDPLHDLHYAYLIVRRDGRFVHSEQIIDGNGNDTFKLDKPKDLLNAAKFCLHEQHLLDETLPLGVEIDGTDEFGNVFVLAQLDPHKSPGKVPKQ